MTSGQLFTNNVVAILDQSNFSYRYISPSIKKIFGVEAKVFMKGGMGVALSMISPEDNAALLSLYKKSHSASDEFTN